AAYPGGACRRFALGEARRERTARIGGKSAPQHASQRQGKNSRNRTSVRHERTIIHAAPRPGGHQLWRSPRQSAPPPRSSLSRRSAYLTPTDCLAARLFGDWSVQPRLQTVDRDIAWPSEKSASVTCVHVIGVVVLTGREVSRGRLAVLRLLCKETGNSITLFEET